MKTMHLFAGAGGQVPLQAAVAWNLCVGSRKVRIAK